jgi:hypothetical protein
MPAGDKEQHSMDNELIEARARDYAHAYLLLVLISLQKKSNPNFGKLVADSFDEYIGRHEPNVANEFTQSVISAARSHLKGLLESDTLSIS